MVVQVLLSSAVPPVLLIPGDHGSASEFLVAAEAAKLGVVLKLLPRDRMRVSAESEEAAKSS